MPTNFREEKVLDVVLAKGDAKHLIGLMQFGSFVVVLVLVVVGLAVAIIAGCLILAVAISILFAATCR